MNSIGRLKIEDLQRMCNEREEESLTLEFKACNELKVGTTFRDKRKQRTRERDDVLDELTKDVTAFLNSAGGTIIYGIQEKKSRADQIDKANAFKPDNKQDDIRPEKIIQWLRAHIRHCPADVYRVFETNDPQSPWYLVIEIPQGEKAYMAKDYRFYKRVGNIVQPMEEYEVVDVMNRTRAAALDLRIGIQSMPHSMPGWVRLLLHIGVTSTNFIASEYGALRLVAAYPISIQREPVARQFVSLDFQEFAVLNVEGRALHAQSVKMGWGAHAGNVVFPGDWYDFHGYALRMVVPSLSLLPDPTYLIVAELFTVNSQSKKALYAIRRQPSIDGFEILKVDDLDYDSVIASALETYDAACEKLKK